jgi:hypothetical protein
MELYPLWKNIFHQFDIYMKYRPKDYALVCIDVFSRYVWAAAMDKEDSPSTAAAILKIFLHMGIQGDQKIINSFKKELSLYFPGITLIASKTHETNKNAIIERAIRTLKNDLLQYLYVHPFPVISGRFVTEEYYELDTTTMILQKICTLRNNTFHRTIRQKPIDVFYGRALNRQIITKKKYPQFNLGDLVIAKPLRARGALSIKIFHYDYDIYIILRQVQIKIAVSFYPRKKHCEKTMVQTLRTTKDYPTTSARALKFSSRLAIFVSRLRNP